MAHSSGNPTWQDSPSTATLITAAALEGIEGAVDGSVKHGDLVFNVQDYGAKGDGTTDDTAALNAAFTAARAVKGRVILEHGKTYIVSNSLPPDDIHIEGYGATLKTKPGLAYAFSVFQPQYGFSSLSIKGLTIDLNKANTTDFGDSNTDIGIYIYIGYGWPGQVTIRDVTVINGHYSGIKIGTAATGTDPTTVPASAVVLDNVTVTGCGYGIWLQYVRDVTIVSPTLSTAVASGIYDYFTYNTKVIGGSVRSTGSHGILTQQSYGFTVSDCSVVGAGGIGIVVGGGSDTLDPCTHFVISGNTAKGCTQSGISVDTTKTSADTTPVPTYGVVADNICTGNGVHGIYLHNAQYLACTGNVMRGNANAGLAMDSLNVAVSGNVMVGNAYGLSFYGNLANYGAHEIGRNVVVGNTAGQYSYGPHGSDNTTLDLQGTGAPAVAAPVGSTYRRVDGGPATSFYVKESGGVTTSGWVVASAAFSVYTPGIYYASQSLGLASAADAVGTAIATSFSLDGTANLATLSVEITTAGATGALRRLGIYRDNGAGYPGALLADLGTAAADGAVGMRELTAPTGTLLSPGLYWIVDVPQVATATVRGHYAIPPVPVGYGTAATISGAPLFGYRATGITGALPSTFPTSIDVTGSPVPRTLWKFS